MRFRAAFLAVSASLSTALLLAACVPDQRPDVSFSVRTCDGAASGGTVKHNACLVFDGSDSHTFVGSSHFSWSAQLQSGVDSSGRPVFSTPLDGFATAAGTGAVTPGASFFANVLDSTIGVRVTLLVSDGHGGHRSASRELLLTNTRPSISNDHAFFLRPRATDIILSPFLVAHLPIAEPENDDLQLTVTQLSPPPVGPYAVMQALRCRDVPAHFKSPFFGTVLPDPSEGDPNAWCFAMLPQDDVTTPAVDESRCQSAGDPCLAVPAAFDDPIDFVFRVKALEENEPDPEPGSTGCAPTTDAAGLPTEIVTCITVRSDDVLWTAASSTVEGGQISRVSSGWHRASAPDLVPRDGNGLTEDGSGRIWAGATYTFCYLVPNCPGGLLGISPNLDVFEATSLGTVLDVTYAAAGAAGAQGLWVASLSRGATFNPGGVGIPSGSAYEVFVPATELSGPAGVDLHAASAGIFTFITGFDHSTGGSPNSIEYPNGMLPQPDGSLWVMTIEYCPDYDSGTSTCVSQTANRQAYFRNLRIVPASMLTVGANVDLQTLPSVFGGAVPLLLPFPLQALVSDGVGGAFVAHDVSGLSVVSEYDANGMLVADVPFPGDAASIAYNHKFDDLWISDLYVAQVFRMHAPLAQTGAYDTVNAFFALPLAMTTDTNGELWIDEHATAYTRRIVHVTENASQADFLDPYASKGIGIATGKAQERGAWHPDLVDLVRQPLSHPIEIPSTTQGPIGATLAGVDPGDGAVYAFSTFVLGETNLLRVDVDGTESPLLALDQAPAACGAIAPDVPNLVVGTALTPGSLWLCVPDFSTPTTTWDAARIGLSRLRAAARDHVVPPAILADCAPDSPPNLVCADDRVPLAALDGTPIYPRAMAFSLTEFHLYVLGDSILDPSVHELMTILDSRIVNGTQGPTRVDASLVLAGANSPSTTAHQPLAPALVFDTTPGSQVDSGGAWVITSNGSYAIQRFELGPNGLAAAAGFRIPSPVPLEAIATDVVGRSVWATANLSGGGTPQGVLSQTVVTSTDGVPTIYGCGSVLVPTEAQALAVHAFSRSAWASGPNETLVRVRAKPSCSVEIEYIRHPDLVGNNPATPGGLSLSAGGP